MLLNCGVGEDSWTVPWTARRSNQSILKEIGPEYSLERLTLKLKLQYFGHLMQRADSFEKTLMLGKIEGRRRRGQQRIRWLDGITNSMDMSLNKFRQLVMGRVAWRASVHRVTKSQTWLNDWTELRISIAIYDSDFNSNTSMDFFPRNSLPECPAPNSILMETASDPMGKDSVLKDCPHFWCQSQIPVATSFSDWFAIGQSFQWPSP